MLEHALSKVDFSVAIGIYMLPSKLNLIIGGTKGYNIKILVSNVDMNIGSNRDINKKEIVIPAVQHDPVGTTIPHNLKIYTEKHNDQKLVITILIVGAALISYHFW